MSKRKQRKLPALSGYRAVWLYAMYDLPVFDKKARRNYTKFRKFLLSEGFIMLQYSVYARYCRTEERSKAFRMRVRKNLPPKGEVRLMYVTDHQFGKQEVFRGKTEKKPEDKPDQLALF